MKFESDKKNTIQYNSILYIEYVTLHREWRLIKVRNNIASSLEVLWLPISIIGVFVQYDEHYYRLPVEETFLNCKF